jgi:hypothetical protein
LLYVSSSLRPFPSDLPQLIQARFSYSSSAFWFKTNKPSARTHFLHSEEVIRPPLSSCFCHFNYVQFTVRNIKLTAVSCCIFLFLSL